MDSLFEILDEANRITSSSRMESGLLNAFHDDHFDGNYSKFDNNLDLWSDGNDAMGLQLTETLHGILPINATEDEPHFFETEIEHRNSYRFHTDNDLSETVYDMDQEEGDFILTNYPAVDTMSESMSPSIEIISVDPNCEFSSPVTIDDDSDIEIDRSSSRNSNYNSNSDSSSIGDYESHSSEEDDDDDQNDAKFQLITVKQEKPDENNTTTKMIAVQSTVTESPQQHLPKNSEQSKSNRIITSFDGIGFSIDDIDLLDNRKSANGFSRTKKSLESEIDVKNFDLATFITQDDFEFIESPRKIRTDGNRATHVNEISIKDIKIEEDKEDEDCLSKADSDTEAIIDIETVHDIDDKPMLLRKQAIQYYPVVDLNESFVQIDDDTKRDPSWCPNNGKTTMKFPKSKTLRQTKTKKSSNLITQCNRMLNNNHTATINNSVIKPNAVLHRKKFGIGKGKNISMCTKPDLYDSLSDGDSCDGTATTTETNCKINESKQNGAIDSNNKFSILNNSITSNNKAIVNNKEADTASVIIPKIVVKIEKPIEVKVEREVDLHNDDANVVEIIAEQTTADNSNSEVSVVVPIKKKLNLEEYKRRRENQLVDDTKIKKTIPFNNNINPVAIIKEEDTRNLDSTRTMVSCVLPNAPNSQKNTAQSRPHAILNSKSDRGFVDPILEAKNKVLRMQELKKAARSKLIDSTVSSKVGPITPILPLEQICKGNYKSQDQSVAKLNPEYEEIIIVSVSCNTDITLPPVFEKLDRNGTAKNGIMQSTSLLSNINDTIKKANAAKISSNSLLSSIQDVVLKKSTTTLLNGAQLLQKSPNIGVSPPSQFSPQKPEMSQTEQSSGVATDTADDDQTAKKEHGEDKIIMHLRKDRIRKKTFSIAIQTDELPQFPPITLLLAQKYSSSQSGNTKKRKRHGDRHYRSRRKNSASSDDDDDRESYRSRSHVRYRSVSSQGTNRSLSPRSSRHSSDRNTRCYSNSRRTVSPYRKIRRRRSSRSSSRTKSRASSSTATDSETGRRARSRDRRNRRYSTSHSSSSDSSSSSRSRSRSRSPRSKSRSRSRSRFSSNRSHSNSHRQPSPAVEERRIVYVGRIERETSKEDLKRKFSSYGPIKQITLHYKDTGMKYGFVTFERAQDAYATIDRGMADSKINMYDISFGGRRAFCRASYSDLDGAATNSLQVLPYSNASRNVPVADDSFEALLQKVKEKMSSTKSATQTTRVKT